MNFFRQIITIEKVSMKVRQIVIIVGISQVSKHSSSGLKLYLKYVSSISSGFTGWVKKNGPSVVLE